MNDQPSDKLNLDLDSALNQLKDFSFRTAWSSTSKSVPRQHNFNPKQRGAPKPYRQPQRENRPARHSRPYTSSPSAQPACAAHLDIQFFPEEGPFQTLIHALKISGKTYSLFEIAQLILEKTDRFHIQIKQQDSSLQPTASIFLALPEKFAFLSEDEALHYVMQHHLEDFFEIETVSIEAPKGQFPFVYRCTKTQTFIAPPNYHKAQALLQAHHQQHAPHVSFDHFLQKLEKVNTPEAIEEWGKQMSTVTHYKAKKELPQQKTLESLEQVRACMREHLYDQCIKASQTVRIPGKSLDHMPAGRIREAVLHQLDQQRRFPLDTANHLRGRLRHLNFAFFKRNGISYLSAIKRRLRVKGLVFSDSIQQLVTFLEANPNIAIHHLPQAYLNIQPNEPDRARSTDDEQKIKALMQDVRWLVKEGYLTEFSDGLLLLCPTAEEPEGEATPKVVPSPSLDEDIDTHVDTIGTDFEDMTSANQAP